MSQDNILLFGEYKLWCITGLDLENAILSLKKHEVDGLFISHHRGYIYNSLACLSNFENLRVLAIDDAKGIDISYAGQIQSLEYLSIGDAGESVNLDMLSNLKQLRLKITKNKCLPREGLAKLRNLAIWNFNNSNLSVLEYYPELRSLEITQSKKLNDLSGIENCQKLLEVGILYCPMLYDIDALANLKELQSIEFQNTKQLKNYVALGKLVGLKRLIIDKSGPLESLNLISDLRNLEHLVIKNTVLGDSNLLPLKYFPLLSHIYLDAKKEYEPIHSELKRLIQARKNQKKQGTDHGL